MLSQCELELELKVKIPQSCDVSLGGVEKSSLGGGGYSVHKIQVKSLLRTSPESEYS